MLSYIAIESLTLTVFLFYQPKKRRKKRENEEGLTVLKGQYAKKEGFISLGLGLNFNSYNSDIFLLK